VQGAVDRVGPGLGKLPLFSQGEFTKALPFDIGAFELSGETAASVGAAQARDLAIACTNACMHLSTAVLFISMSLSWLAFWGPRPYTMIATAGLTVYNSFFAYVLNASDASAARFRVALAVIFMAGTFGMGNTGKATDPRDISWEATYIDGHLTGLGMCIISFIIPVAVIGVLVMTPFLTVDYFANNALLRTGL
jgi:hypothetical protein